MAIGHEDQVEAPVFRAGWHWIPVTGDSSNCLSSSPDFVHYYVVQIQQGFSEVGNTITRQTTIQNSFSNILKQKYQAKPHPGTPTSFSIICLLLNQLKHKITC